jgi:hypothetical protein
VSGLGASQAEAQQEVLVGMGLLAGSSVMLLTALWGACLIVGRCDLVEHPRIHLLVAKDKTLTKGLSLTGDVFMVKLNVGYYFFGGPRLMLIFFFEGVCEQERELPMMSKRSGRLGS